MSSFWDGFLKRAAARVPGVLSQGLATATKLPGQGVTSGLHSRGGLRQTATTYHPLAADKMKMPPAATPTVGPMA